MSIKQLASCNRVDRTSWRASDCSWQNDIVCESVSRDSAGSWSVGVNAQEVGGLLLYGRYRPALFPKQDWTYRSFPYKLTDRKSTRLNSSHVAISYAVF